MFRQNDWIDEVSRGQRIISVAVTHPEVQHKVRIQDFERWLESQGRTLAEMSLKVGDENSWVKHELLLGRREIVHD